MLLRGRFGAYASPVKVVTHYAGFALGYIAFAAVWTVLFGLLIGVPLYILDRVVNGW